MAKHIFLFEGWLGYGSDGWADLLAGKSLQNNHGGNLLKVIASRIPFTPAGGSAGCTPRTDFAPRDTVLSYFQYQAADQAAAYAQSIGIHRPFMLNNKPAFHTLIIIGHSFGGDAAWRFSALLSMAPLTANLGITFDPRSIADLGNGDDHASWALNPESYASAWQNYFRPNGGLFKGYPLPAPPNSKVQNIPQPDTYDHSGMIAQIWNDPQLNLQAAIDAVGTARAAPQGDQYIDASAGKTQSPA